jgi:hypothetical protein
MDNWGTGDSFFAFFTSDSEFGSTQDCLSSKDWQSLAPQLLCTTITPPWLYGGRPFGADLKPDPLKLEQSPRLLQFAVRVFAINHPQSPIPNHNSPFMPPFQG